MDMICTLSDIQQSVMYLYYYIYYICNVLSRQQFNLNIITILISKTFSLSYPLGFLLSNHTWLFFENGLRQFHQLSVCRLIDSFKMNIASFVWMTTVAYI